MAAETDGDRIHGAVMTFNETLEDNAAALREGAVAAAERERPRSAKSDALARHDQAITHLSESLDAYGKGNDLVSVSELRLAVGELARAVRALCDAVQD